MRIDHDAVLHGEARGLCQRIVRLHAGADQYEIGHIEIAFVVFERDAAVELRRRLHDRCRKLEFDAAMLMLGEDQGAGFLVASPRHDPRRKLDHRHLDAEFGRGGGRFKTDQAGADHDEMLAIGKAGLDRPRMRFGAEVMHPRHALGQHRQFPHQRAGRDHQRVIGQRPAGGDGLVGRTVDGGAARAGFDRDAVLGEAAGTGDQGVLGAAFAEQHRLGQRRFFIGFAGLVGHQRDVGRGIAFLGFNCGKDRRRPAADDHNIARHSESSGSIPAGR